MTRTDPHGAASRYPAGWRALHWIVAALVILQIPGGLVIEGYERATVEAVNAALGENAFNTLYDLHKSVGLTILGLMILRVVIRARRGAPPYAEPPPRARRLAAEAVHGALYLLLIVTPVVGWIGVSAYPAPVPFFFLVDLRLPLAADQPWAEWLLGGVHGPLGILIGILAAAHILAALQHRFLRRDEVMGRMLP